MQKYSGNLAILAIAFREDEKNIPGLINEWGIKYPICPDPDGKAAREFEVSALPRGFLLDHKGRLIASFEGMSEKNRNELVKKLAALKPEIMQYRAAGPSFFVKPFAELTRTGEKGMIWRDKLRSWIAGEGVRIAASPMDADYVISGNVSRIGDVEGVEIVFSHYGEKETGFTDRVKKGDDARLKRIFIETLHSIPWVPAKK